MSLTTGRGPLSGQPLGAFNVPMPDGIVYIEPFQRRVRAVLGDRVMIDTEQVCLVHRLGQPPAYLFPADAVGALPAEPEAGAEGWVRVPWNAVGAWYEEEQEVHAHPRNPYHRVDTLRTCRRLEVRVANSVLVDSTDTVGVYETALEARLYVAPDHVRTDLLERSITTSYCPYKGTATYWSAVVGPHRVEDVAWSYEDPLLECSAIRGLLSFDAQRTTLTTDLPKPPAPG